MNLGKGQIIFAIVFFIAFVVAMLWAYRKDKTINNIYFSKSYKILLFIILLLVVLFVFVKLKSI